MPASAPSRRSAPTTTAGALGWLLVTLLLAGCGAGTAGPPPDDRSPGQTATSPVASGSPGAAGSPQPAGKLLVIVEENRSTADVTAHMPYLTAAAARYGSATQYHALRHPSLPNYLVIAGGSLFDVTDDRNPSAHPLSGPSVFGQLLAAGHTTKTYAEAMQGNCATENQGRYAVRHNPWTYFTDPAERAACAKFDVPAGTTTAGQLVDDVKAGQLPTFSLVIPDACNDGHDCSAATADRWLRDWLPVIQSGPDFADGKLTIVVTWDEDDGSDGNRVAFVVVNPKLTGRAVDSQLDHYALSATISALGGQPPLREANGAPDLLHAFGLA